MMPPRPVAAPSGLHLHSCLSALPRLAKAGEIERVNAQFVRVELVKQFRIIDRVLTPEDQEITPTMKLKRKFAHQKFSACFSYRRSNIRRGRQLSASRGARGYLGPEPIRLRARRNASGNRRTCR
jgi:hypothetical protein